MIHRKKNRPALQRRDILTCLFSVFFFFFFFFLSFFLSFFLLSPPPFIENLFKSSSTQFLVVLFFIAFCTAPFCSKHFVLGLFVMSLSTELFFLVVLLLLLLSMIAFSYDLICRAPFSLLSATFSLYLSHLPPSSFLEWLSSEQFAESDLFRS